MGTLANIKSIFKHHPQPTNVHKYTTKLSASEESSTFPYTTTSSPPLPRAR